MEDLNEFLQKPIDGERVDRHSHDIPGHVIEKLETIGLPTDGADEVVVEAAYWSGRLVGVTTVDRNQP